VNFIWIPTSGRPGSKKCEERLLLLYEPPEAGSNAGANPLEERIGAFVQAVHRSIADSTSLEGSGDEARFWQGKKDWPSTEPS